MAPDNQQPVQVAQPAQPVQQTQAPVPAAQPPQVSQPAAPVMVLPILISGNIEVHRLQRELEALEDYMVQNKIRTPGKQVPLPKTSRLLELLSAENHLNLLLPNHRAQLKLFLDQIVAYSPVLHLSFASDPSSAFMAKVVAWFRQNVHAYALIQLGLQPAIAAGFILRTTNKQFDHSLAKHFNKQGHLLVEALEAEASK